jgi:hypothetical protein
MEAGLYPFSLVKTKGDLPMKKTTKFAKTKPAQLSLLNPKCAGIDIGAAEIFVCIARTASEQEVRSFPTFTADLKRMIQWLKENGVESVAMESWSSRLL